MSVDRRIVIAGASGLIGRALGDPLRGMGFRVVRLVRRAARGADEASWQPAEGELDPSILEDAHAVINLCGEGIADGRWTARRKEQIRRSRIEPTRLIASTIAHVLHKPSVLINASATGYYGSRGDEQVDERAAAGEGFLPEVCREWEQATKPAEAAGVRTVLLRTGIVLARGGGILQKLVPIFRLGLGGAVGGGRQWMSWISLEDEIAAILRSLTDGSISGPVNATAPAAVTNRDFGRTLARVLHRPAIAPLPSFMVKLLFGEMGERLLLEGVHAKPAVLLSKGFTFKHPTLESALRHELGG
jgi:uncharacterized protein (TIGR01777 family)